MLIAHRVDHIRAAEDSAAAHLGADELMQRAADGLAAELALLIPAGESTLMLIGPGNNGGDALFAAARLCHGGRSIDLCVLDKSTVHQAGIDAALAAGARVVERPDGHHFVVDAVFGIGARPGLEGVAAGWAEWVRHTGPYVIAVDVPSGIGVDDGTCPGEFIPANRTVTFGTYKIGSLVGPGQSAGGPDLPVRVDIGLDSYLAQPALEALQVSDGARFRDAVVPRPADHKYLRGVVGIRAGSASFAGAAHLTVAGAQAGPAGMVRFVGEQSLADRVVDRAPEVVSSSGQVQCWVVGPGGATSADPLDQAINDEVPLVVDATALKYLPPRFSVDTVLTPHAGELAAMLETDRSSVEADPLKHARLAAGRWRANVLLKGPRTIIVSTDGRIRVNLSGTPWLATAGSGDVLAGLIGSLMAAGMAGFDAASVAAFVHGIAGQRSVADGPVIATAIAAQLPRTLADFVEGRLSETAAT